MQRPPVTENHKSSDPKNLIFLNQSSSPSKNYANGPEVNIDVSQFDPSPVKKENLRSQAIQKPSPAATNTIEPVPPRF